MKQVGTAYFELGMFHLKIFWIAKLQNVKKSVPCIKKLYTFAPKLDSNLKHFIR